MQLSTTPGSHLLPLLAAYIGVGCQQLACTSTAQRTRHTGSPHGAHRLGCSAGLLSSSSYPAPPAAFALRACVCFAVFTTCRGQNSRRQTSAAGSPALAELGA